MISEQNELQPDDFRALALQLAAFTELLEQRGQQAVQQTREAAQQVSQVAQQAAASSERMTTAAIEKFRQAAVEAVSGGMRQPVEQAAREMASNTQGLHQATRELEARVRTAGRSVAATAWKAFVASALASVAIVGVAIYMGIRAHQDIERAEWIGLINSAIANGNLRQCNDAGLCARVGKEWVRIDR